MLFRSKKGTTTGELEYVSKTAASGTAGELTSVTLSIPATGGSTGIGGGAVVTADVTAVTANKVSDINITTAKGAQGAVLVIDDALKQIDSQRAELGAVQNRFDNTISNCRTSLRTSPLRAAVLKTPTSQLKPLTSARTRSCSRLVPRSLPRPSSCHRLF